jgi:hypothetical protein
MECEIKPVIIDVFRQEFDIKFRLTTEELIALKLVFHNSREEYVGYDNVETNFFNVLTEAINSAKINL